MVHASCVSDLSDIKLDVEFMSRQPIDVNLATLLEANANAQHEVERNLRYRVLQNELRIVLSYLGDPSLQSELQLDKQNFVGTAGHIKRFVSESVGLGMLTAAAEEYFRWQYDADLIYNFDILPGELQEKFGKRGVRPDLLFKFDDGLRELAGEARGRSGVGPQGDAFRPDQLIGSLAYEPLMEVPAAVAQRQRVTTDALGRGERRAQRLFETAPPAPAREARSLFGREVRGGWTTADFARPSNVRMFLGVTDQPIPSSDLRIARSRRRRGASRVRTEYETAVSDRLLIVVTESDNPEPPWSRVEVAVQEDQSDD